MSDPYVQERRDPAELEAIDVALIERYIAAKRRAEKPLEPRTINRHLNLLSLILISAAKQGLVRSNPVPSVDRPREPRRHWRTLESAEVGRVLRAFDELVGEAEGDEERAWREQARAIFQTTVTAGLRRGEILGLCWRSVHLADPDGPTLRVERTWVRSAFDTPNSEAGERTTSLGPALAEALFEHRARSHYRGDDELVFCSPTTGTPIDSARYGKTFRLALAKAKITDHVRPFHDQRHAAITHDAAAGNAPMAIMARAGHSDFKTTQL